MSDYWATESRKNWHSGIGNQPSHEQLQIGCLQRIAAATEDMASDYRRLHRERDAYERLYRNACERERALERSNAALRGVITKMKRSRHA